MPPKVKFDREKIIDLAFEYVRENGWDGLSARYLAARLNSSTGPIYTHFASMAELEDEVVKRALGLYYKSLSEPITGDKWVDSGVALIRFAMKEKHLFRCMNDEKHCAVQKKHARAVWAALGDDLADHPLFEGLSEMERMRVRVARWWLIHGLASLVNNGWYTDEDDLPIESIVETVSKALLTGLEGSELELPKPEYGDK